MQTLTKGPATIGVVGGTGFVGRHLANELTRRGYRLKVLTRRRERNRSLLVFPTLSLVDADVHDESALTEALKGCDAVVNLVGILNGHGDAGDSFRGTHAELPAKIVEACRRNGIGRYLHMSSLGAARDAPSDYLRTKAAGESVAHAAAQHGLAVTSFRPSVIFGLDDDFFNRFAALLRQIPLFFPLACPNARFAPVFVGDVVAAFADALHDKRTIGQAYELCGPKQYRLRELVDYTAALAGVRRQIIELNDGLSKLQARLLEFAPGKPFTRDNYLSMQVDSVCGKGPGLTALGITPTGIEAVVPHYIGQRDRNADYTQYRRLARR